MAKNRSRRASPAQAAWRKEFAKIMKSGGFKKGRKKSKKSKTAKSSAGLELLKKKKKKAAKKAAPKAKKVAAKAKKKAAPKAKKAAHKAHAHKGHPAHKPGKKKRRNPAVTAAAKPAAAKPAAAKKPAAKKPAAKPAAKAAAKPSASSGSAAEIAKFQEEQFQAESIVGQSQEHARMLARKRKYRAKNQKSINNINKKLSNVRLRYKNYPTGKRGVPGPATRRILRTRKAALNLQKSKFLGNLNAGQQKMLASSGLMKVRNNPSFGQIFSDLGGLAPKLGVHAVALAGAAIAGQKIGEQVCKMLTEKDKAAPTTGFSGFVCNNAVTIGTVTAAIAAYEALKHGSPKTRPFAGAALLGGLAAAFVHAAARVQTKVDATTKVASSNLGKDLGLPLALGDYTSINGFVDVGGRAIAVDGLGSSTLTGSTLGDYMSLSGSTLTGSSLGEYMGLSGSTLTGSSLGEIGQMSEGRQGSRALGAPGDPTVEEFMDDEEEDEEGSLSGSIFDD